MRGVYVDSCSNSSYRLSTEVVVLCVGFMGSRVGLVPYINFQIFFYAYEWLFLKCEVAVQRPGEQVVASAEQHRKESAQSHKRVTEMI